MNVKGWIYGKLKASTTLKGLISDRLYFFYPDQFTKLPVVAYSESNHRETDYWDDRAEAVESTVTIDIYHNASTSAVFDAIVAIMDAAFFNLDFATDLYETETKIQHKNCRFRRVVRASDLT